jgi:Holliday junction DNA helicase RuvA
MFNSLSGTITGKFPQKVYIDTHGIEWDVSVPDVTLDEIPAVGQQGKIYTWMQHTDVLMVLYGFASVEERTLFLDLLKVDGIGPKGALKIMSNVSAQELVTVLDDGNLAALEKIPGVGKKTAGKMLLQLKGKLSLENNQNSNSVRADTSPYADVIAALANMGYDRKDAEQTVGEIAAAVKNDEAYHNSSAKEIEDTVFRRAIVELAQ